MRLFIAIDFNELKDYFKELQSKIDSSSAELKEVSTFHLTLKFLGEVPDDKVNAIKERLSRIKLKSFSLKLDKIGVFPTENYIRVIWVGASPKEQVIELNKMIEEALKEFNFKKDSFKFHPHITLARVKFVKDKENFIKTLKEIETEEKEIQIKDFRLVKSTLKREGPVYDDVHIIKLTQN